MVVIREKGFQAQLGLFTVVTLIMGSMIGSGIFRLPAEMAAITGSAWLVLFAWIAGAILTLCGAFTFAEFASAFPRTGGQYVFLQESMGANWSFMYGWTMFLAIQTSIIAAVAAVFATFTGFFFDLPGRALDIGILTIPPWGETFLAVGLIWFLTVVNYFGVKHGAIIQNISTVMKVAALLLIVVAVFSFGEPRSSYSGFAGQMGTFAAGTFGLALASSLFAYDGWPQATYVMGEVKDPKKTVPKALLLGVGGVAVVYILATAAYFYVLDFSQASGAARIASDAVQAVVGSQGAAMVAAAVMVSTFGTVNAYVLTSPRIFYAVSKDGLFPGAFGRLSRNKTPTYGLWYQGIWASLLTLTGTYLELVLVVVMGIWMFYIPTAIGYFKLKRASPHLFEGFRMPLSPWPAYIFILSAIGITAMFVIRAILGYEVELRTVVILGAVVVSGIPFMLRRAKTAATKAPTRTPGEVPDVPPAAAAPPPPKPPRRGRRRPGLPTPPTPVA